MKKYLIILLILAGSAYGQYMGSNPNSGRGIPYFKFNVFRIYQDTSAHIIGVSEILYDDLTFELFRDEYHAEYEITIFIQDEDGEKTLGYITRNYKVTLKDFKKTNSRKIKDRHSIQFPLNPGEYKFVAIITDINNGKRVKRNLETEIDDIFDTGILISDILFYQVNPKSGERLILLDNNFNREETEIWVHVSIATISDEDPIDISIQYYESQDNKTILSDTTIAPMKMVNLWHKVDLRNKKESQNSLLISASQGGKEYENSRAITFFWTRSPQTDTDIKNALKQMIYVAPEDSIDKYLELGREDQIGYFIRFWKMMDPSPKSEHNELKDEYFHRINQANQFYTFFKNPGCFTDRGRILIKFGPPDEIDRHPFDDYSRPYIIWIYHNLKKTFLFVDTAGIGEYRLDPDYYIYEFN